MSDRTTAARLDAAKRHREENRHDQAIRELEAVIASEPRNEEAHILLGLEYHHRADYERALKALTVVRGLNPANNEVYLLMGNILSCQGKYDLAEKAFEESLQRNAANKADAYFELGKIREQRNEYRKAAGEFERSLRCRHDPAVVLRIVHLYKLIGDWEKVQDTINDHIGKIDAGDAFLKNIFINEREIAQGKLVLSSKPRSLIITLTNRCNLDCMMCEAKHLPWDISEKTLEEAVSYFPYLEHAMWQGGEVFLLKNFMDILKESKKYPRMKQVIISNGMAFNAEILEELATHPNLTLSISVDAAQKELLERIRKGIRMEKLVENIRHLNELRQKYRSTMRLNVNVTVMKSNHRHLLDIVEFAGKYRFDFVFLTTIYGNADNDENIFLSGDRAALDYLEETIDVIEERARECGVVVHNWLPIQRRKKAPPDAAAPGASAGADGKNTGEKKGFLCYAPWQRLYLDWKGNLFPDCMCLPNKAAGNIRDHTIETFWNSDGMQRYRQKMRDGDYFDLCRPYCIAGRVEHLI